MYSLLTIYLYGFNFLNSMASIVDRISGRFLVDLKSDSMQFHHKIGLNACKVTIENWKIVQKILSWNRIMRSVYRAQSYNAQRV